MGYHDKVRSTFNLNQLKEANPLKVSMTPAFVGKFTCSGEGVLY